MAKSNAAQKAWDRVSVIDQEIGECIDTIGRSRLRGGAESTRQLRDAAHYMEIALPMLRALKEGRSAEKPRKGR